MLVYDGNQVQVLHLLPIPLHIRQQHKAILWVWVLKHNPICFFLLLQNVVNPLQCHGNILQDTNISIKDKGGSSILKTRGMHRLNSILHQGIPLRGGGRLNSILHQGIPLRGGPDSTVFYTKAYHWGGGPDSTVFYTKAYHWGGGQTQQYSTPRHTIWGGGHWSGACPSDNYTLWTQFPAIILHSLPKNEVQKDHGDDKCRCLIGDHHKTDFWSITSHYYGNHAAQVKAFVVLKGKRNYPLSDGSSIVKSPTA